MNSILKQFARSVGFPLIHQLGADKLLSARSSTNVLQITYHGVSAGDHTMFSPRSIPADIFERQLAYFKKNFDVVSVREALDWKRSGFRPKRKTLAISFDDGFTNNYTVLLPLLEKYEIPATVLVCGAPLLATGPRYLWPELLQTLKYFHPDAAFEVGGVRFEKMRAVHNGQSLSTWIKTLLPEERFSVLAELMERFNLEQQLQQIPREAWEIMSADQLRALSASPWVEIGAHGHWHSNLGNIPLAMAVEDLKMSKDVLESIVGQSINILAYPDGSYTRALVDASEQLGFTHQLAVNYQHPEDLKDPRIVKRHGVSATTTLESTLFFIHRAFAQNGKS